MNELFLLCQNTEPELSKTFVVNITSVRLLKSDDSSDAGDGVRELWVSRQTAVTSVVISEHGNARGVIQFDVLRVGSFVSFYMSLEFQRFELQFSNF